MAMESISKGHFSRPVSGELSQRVWRITVGHVEKTLKSIFV
jgi:hypothetical protein